MLLVTLNGRMCNAAMLRSVKPALIRRALDVSFRNIFGTYSERAC